DRAGAIASLNQVRTLSGKLSAIDAAKVTTDAEFVAALLHEREFSLLFEGGHRWIDARRLKQLSTLPIFVDTDPMTNQPLPDMLNVRFPIPLSECNARPGEPACMLGST